MVHLPQLIFDLALILCSAGVVTLIFKRLRQPLVLGYIIAGLLVSPNFTLFPSIIDMTNVEIWAEIGVIVLLFTLGLEFSFKKLMKVGGTASITALVQIVCMLFLGYATGRWLGWSNMDSIFLGAILSMSSTTIILRAFDELGVKSKKFAGIVFGALIIEDLVAIVLMVLLSTIAVSREFAGSEMMYSILKLIFFLVLWFLGGIFFIPTFLKAIRKLLNEETTLIISLSLCLLMVILAEKAGFSPALGAFIMGSILAETTHAERIEHSIKSVKDLFGAVFFVSVGMMIDPAMLVEYAFPILIVTLITIVGKTLGTALGALISGQPLKQSVQAGMSLAQIGEFSFIIATLGLTLKVTSSFLYPITVAVSAVTTFTTPYMIRFAEPVYHWLDRVLPVKWKNKLTRYSAGTQTINAVSDWQVVIKSYISNVIIFMVVLVAIILLSSRYILPVITERAGHATWGTVLTVLLTLVVMAPFLWALAVRNLYTETTARISRQNKYLGPLWLLRIVRIGLAAACIAFLLKSFFSTAIAMAGIVAIILLFFTFAGKIQSFYIRIEKRFLSNFNDRELQEQKQQQADRQRDAAGLPESETSLAPWDAHIAPVALAPESSGIGKTLFELRWRETAGINIAMIKRGSLTILVPGRNERVYPGDILYVLGTDVQLNRFNALIRPSKNIAQYQKDSEVSLRKIIVRENSELAGKSIRESGIREKVKGLIVGIERNEKRVLNPESTWVFENEDIVWIVGDAELIDSI